MELDGGKASKSKKWVLMMFKKKKQSYNLSIAKRTSQLVRDN